MTSRLSLTFLYCIHLAHSVQSKSQSVRRRFRFVSRQIIYPRVEYCLGSEVDFVCCGPCGNICSRSKGTSRERKEEKKKRRKELGPTGWIRESWGRESSAHACSREALALTKSRGMSWQPRPPRRPVKLPDKPNKRQHRPLFFFPIPSNALHC